MLKPTQLFLFLFLIVFPCTAVSASVCDHVSLPFLQQHLPLPVTAKIIKKQERGSVCEVILQTQNEIAPIYAGKDFVLIGQLLQHKESVTQKTMIELQEKEKEEKNKLSLDKMMQDSKKESFFKTHFMTLKQFSAITLAPQGTSKYEIYVITDPICSHCKRLLKALHQLVQQSELTVHIIIFPILQEKNQNLAVQAICQRSNFDEYMAMQTVSQDLQCPEGKKYIEKLSQFLKQAEITSVPLTIGPEAKWLVEGNRIAEIKSHLNREDDDKCRPTEQIPCD